MKQIFTITADTENHAGVLHRLTSVFTRRKVNIESLCVSETHVDGISRFTISVKLEEVQVQKIIAQIARIIEVKYVAYYTDNQLLFKELAFLKIAVSSIEERRSVEDVARRYNSSVALVDDRTIVLEKIGSEADISSLYHLLSEYRILEFVRSGRIAVTRLSDVTRFSEDSDDRSSKARMVILSTPPVVS
jgi:acetolactate synthase-1/3 small subunit